jgi:ribosomal protein L9
MPSLSNVLEQEAKVEAKIAAIGERTVELAAATAPKVAETARKTGHSLANFGAVAGDTIIAALKSQQLGDLAKMGLSLSAARMAGQQVVRFAMRRPVLVVVGGLALTQLGLAIHRRMKEDAAAS